MTGGMIPPLFVKICSNRFSERLLGRVEPSEDGVVMDQSRRVGLHA